MSDVTFFEETLTDAEWVALDDARDRLTDFYRGQRGPYEKIPADIRLLLRAFKEKRHEAFTLREQTSAGRPVADERLSAEAIDEVLSFLRGDHHHIFVEGGVRDVHGERAQTRVADTIRALIDRNKALEAERGIGVDDLNGDISDLSAILATRDAEIASLKAERERLIAAMEHASHSGEVDDLCAVLNAIEEKEAANV